jgi:hypothetical protein
VNVFKQVHDGDGLREYIFHHGQHKPLFAP